jgi:hypothetical protein
VLEIAKPNEDHCGGWIGFGPDGSVDLPTGDGGIQHDPANHAQKLETDNIVDDDRELCRVVGPGPSSVPAASRAALELLAALIAISGAAWLRSRPLTRNPSHSRRDERRLRVDGRRAPRVG